MEPTNGVVKHFDFEQAHQPNQINCEYVLCWHWCTAWYRNSFMQRIMFVMIFYLFSTHVASSASRKVGQPITISIEMSIEYISNFDFVKQTFDVIAEVEYGLLSWIDVGELRRDVSIGQMTNPFSSIQFDVIDSHTIGIVDYAVSRKNATGMKKKEKLTVACHFSHYIPFDRHICIMKMIESRHSSDELILTWKSPPKLSSVSMNTPFLPSMRSQQRRAFTKGVYHRRPQCQQLYPTHAWQYSSNSFDHFGCRVLLVSFSISFQIIICTFFLHSVSVPVSAVTPADVWCALLGAQSTIAVLIICFSTIIESEVKKCRALSIGSKDVRDESRQRRRTTNCAKGDVLEGKQSRYEGRGRVFDARRGAAWD
ncbi:hypothetical protein KIN20_014483 [Parelaphostrongylus tenuis]|uniref:Neurotransmitter-gated ion-channel ligand-binding domain-containing protein n=1 Tax=Parelaphostrongylus tenuis TaxID=148309 RepID=A0AAD5MF13_PARTN|nr:hypothetical protein KIN20_014483 [Parelaphostrongylus tenuis]